LKVIVASRSKRWGLSVIVDGAFAYTLPKRTHFTDELTSRLLCALKAAGHKERSLCLTPKPRRSWKRLSEGDKELQSEHYPTGVSFRNGAEYITVTRSLWFTPLARLWFDASASCCFLLNQATATAEYNGNLRDPNLADHRWNYSQHEYGIKYWLKQRRRKGEYGG